MTGDVDNDGSIITLSDFSTSPIPDSTSYTWYDYNGDGAQDADEPSVMVPNQYYSKWRDLNSDGEISQYEKYITYVSAWNDYISDPFTGTRTPNT